MTDIVDSKTRSRMMSSIRGKDTAPEITVRKALHAHGFRFRLHDSELPGKPDIVLPRYRVAIFVHGCFWHRHRQCRLAATPSTRTEFWRKKFDRNVSRDAENREALRNLGWRVFLIWECGLKRRPEPLIDEITEAILDPSITEAEFPSSTP